MDNTAQGEARGLSIVNTAATLTNVSFRGNEAGTAGGGMVASDSDLTLINVLFSGNKATDPGSVAGALYIGGGSVTLTNVTISGNQAGSGGAYVNQFSDLKIVNTIVWGNVSTDGGSQIFNSGSTPVISYSLIQGSGGSGGGWDAALGSDGGNNLDVDPGFVAPLAASSAPTSTGDYQLQTTSPAIDVGNSAANAVKSDLNGKARLQGGVIDLGAYEAPLTCPAGGVLYVKQGGAGTQSGKSWANAFAYLQNALRVTPPCEIWVAKGVYYPDEGNGQLNNQDDFFFLRGALPSMAALWAQRVTASSAIGKPTSLCSAATWSRTTPARMPMVWSPATPKPMW